MKDPGWVRWYHAMHSERCRAHGEEFEAYVTKLITFGDATFINPQPMGRDGDGGCDGLGDEGRIWYSCYGQRATTAVEGKLVEKIRSDYQKMRANQQGVSSWRFVTNAQVGMKTIQMISHIRASERTQSAPISVEVWQPDRLWQFAQRRYSESDWDALLPGCPHMQDVRLADLQPLLEELEQGVPAVEQTIQDLRPVPADKLEANRLPPTTIAEIEAGMRFAAVIDTWYQHRGKIEAADIAGHQFHELYVSERVRTQDPAEIINGLYVAVGGSDFRLDSRRAAAVFAVTAYFFERCDIFEHPEDLRGC